MRIDRPRDGADEPVTPSSQDQSPELWDGPRRITPEERRAEFDALQKLADEEEAKYAKQKAESERPLTRTEHRERLRDLNDRDQADPEPAIREGVAKTDEKPEGRQWQTIEEEIGELKSWSSYKSARNELGTVEGTEIHHIVEQSQGEPKRAQFDVARINTSDNMTRLPKDVHTNISALYSSRPPGFEVKVRDWLGGKDWDFQYDYGCRVIDNEMRRHDDVDND